MTQNSAELDFRGAETDLRNYTSIVDHDYISPLSGSLTILSSNGQRSKHHRTISSIGVPGVHVSIHVATVAAFDD
jgi:hypothetical protein